MIEKVLCVGPEGNKVTRAVLIRAYSQGVLEPGSSWLARFLPPNVVTIAERNTGCRGRNLRIITMEKQRGLERLWRKEAQILYAAEQKTIALIEDAIEGRLK